jgi:hypothetical protein
VRLRLQSDADFSDQNSTTTALPTQSLKTGVGFFSNFLTTFDHSGMTPTVEIERIQRA